MRLIDADKLESGEVIIPTENGRYEYVEVFYKDDVDNAPSVDAEPVRHGMWINISISANGNESSAECDLCGARVHNNLSSVINYCPNCGANMGVVKHETD